jgi:O-antigen ligase
MDTIRPWPVYLMAAALPFSMAAISIAKVGILMAGLIALVWAICRRSPFANLRDLHSVKLVLALLCALMLGITYTDVPAAQALGDWGKYAKLVIIPLTVVLLRSTAECQTAVTVLLVVQGFIVLSSVALTQGAHLPWVPSARNAPGTVFSSYLDQAIMTAGFVAMAWHLRHRVKGGSPRWRLACIVFAALGVVNVLVLLPGRSGQIAMLVVLTLAAWWAVPGRWRVAMVAVPLLVTALAAISPSTFHDRMGAAVKEVQAYAQRDDKTTSSGIRLNFWHRSLQAIEDKPLTGHGLGSWSQQFLRFAGPGASLGVNPRSNPHQEYLQLGVQIGVAGIAIFIALIAYLWRDARLFSADIQHASRSLTAVFAVACLFNSALFDAVIGDYFVFVLGLLLALGLNEGAWRHASNDSHFSPVGNAP